MKVKTAKCNLCPETYTIVRGCTSGLWSHIQHNHHQEYLKYNNGQLSVKNKKEKKVDPKQKDIRDYGPPYNKSSPEYNRKLNAVMKYIVSDGKPLSTIQNSEFLNMLHAFDPRMSLPSRRTITDQNLPEMYHQKKADILHEIVSLKKSMKIPCVNLTTDIWSSISMEPYISLTMHYLNCEFELCARTLETVYVADQKTGVNLAEVITELLETWGLSKTDIRAITTDSASNMIKMGREANLFRIPCFGHILHNAIGKAMDNSDVKSVTAKLKRIVAYFHQSHKRQKSLSAELKKNGKSACHLIADCPTRWGSTFDMYDRIHGNMDEIKKVLVIDAQHLVPTVDERAVIKDVTEALMDYRCFTDGFSGDHQVTVSAVLPCLRTLHTLQYSSSISARSRELRNTIWSYINDK